MGEDNVETARKWLEISTRFELESLTLKGLKINGVEKGVIRCSFVVPEELSDKDGNWHAGAMAILIDDVAACTVLSVTGMPMSSVDFDISYYSTAKINEEVEIEVKVAAQAGNLVSVTGTIRKSGSGEKVAFAKQWMTLINPTRSLISSKL